MRIIVWGLKRETPTGTNKDWRLGTGQTQIFVGRVVRAGREHETVAYVVGLFCSTVGGTFRRARHLSLPLHTRKAQGSGLGGTGSCGLWAGAPKKRRGGTCTAVVLCRLVSSRTNHRAFVFVGIIYITRQRKYNAYDLHSNKATPCRSSHDTTA